MTDTNKDFQVPKLRPSVNRLLSRSNILDGKVKTYFGPRQRPNSFPGVSGQDIGFDGFTRDDAVSAEFPTFSEHEYRPPQDWIPSGYLLRPPQVVWLSNSVKIAFNHNYFVPDEAQYSYDSTLASDASGLSDSVSSVFENVKSRIESLRPGRTFVNIIDWTIDIPENDLAWDQHCLENQILPLACPDNSESFFGTKFLHIWVGPYTEDYLSQDDEGFIHHNRNIFVWDEGTEVGFGWSNDAIVTVSDPGGSGMDGEPGSHTHDFLTWVCDQSKIETDASNYASGAFEFSGNENLFPGTIENLTSVVPRFQKYGVRLYSMDLTPDIPTPIPVFAQSGTPAEAALISHPEGSTQESFVPFSGDWLLDAFSNINELNTSQLLQGLSYFSQAIYDEMESALSGCDVKHSGGASDATVDALVAQIAEFFGFDPSSGKDIPVKPPQPK